MTTTPAAQNLLFNAYSTVGGWGIACGVEPGPFATAWQMLGWPPGTLTPCLFAAGDRPANDNPFISTR